MENKKIAFKFMAIADTHHTALNPENRIDNLFDATLEKLEECRNICKEENVDALLHLGDVFNSPDISDNIAGIIGEEYKKFGIDVFAIAGNHDLRGNNISSLPQTKLGLLGACGIFKLINYGDLIILEKNGLSVQLTGSPSDFGIDSNKDAFILKNKKADVAIHMAHGMLLKEETTKHSYVPINDIQYATVADITLCGHYHLGFDTYLFDGKYWANPGSLVRKYNFVEEINRIPQVAIINVYEDKTFDLELVKLKCAKPGNEVLDRTKMETKKAYQEKLKDFKESLKIDLLDTSLQLSTEDALKKIAIKENIDDQVLKLALEKLSSASSLLKFEEI